VAHHLQRFWTPAMCATLSAYVRDGGAAEPLVQEAVKRLHTKT
jgi:hypothetical protein